MAFRTTTLGLTVILTGALAGACSSADDTSGVQNGVIPGFGGFGGFGAGAVPSYGGSTGGDTSFQGVGGASPLGNGGASPFGNGGASPFGSGGASPLGGGGASPLGSGGSPAPGGGGAPNGSGGEGILGAGGVISGTGGEGPQGSGGSIGGTGPAPTSDSASKQGTCAVQQYTSGVPAGADYVNPTVYYPTNCPAPFPGVVVIPGFTELQGAINQWGTFLASHGFVVMMIDSAANGAGNTLVVPASRASGLTEGVTTLQGENTRSGSPLVGKIATTQMAIMGHSMGGGGTLLAANTHPELKAAIGLCPWNPGVTYPTDTVPSLFFDGTADTLVPPAAATAEYQSIPTTTPKVYAEFNGGTHYVANTPLGPAASDAIVARIGLSWLEVHVVGDTRYQQFIVKDASMSAWDVKP